MAQRLRCPGSRPSVSYEWIKGDKEYEIPMESNGETQTKTTSQTT